MQANVFNSRLYVEDLVSKIYQACRVVTNSDLEGRIFLSHPHTINGFFSCSPLNTTFCIGKT